LSSSFAQSCKSTESRLQESKDAVVAARPSD
jgi:hypothetical protein